jgi:prepilin-type N-terminal cleavage/methylation domain-containing protein
MTPAGDAAGFSLVELLVVIAIVSVLAVSVTLAVPRASGGTRAAAVLLEDDLEALRLEAMLTGLDHAISPLPNGWQAEAAVSGGGWSHRYRRELDGIEVRATVARLILRADGSLSEGAFQVWDGTSSALCSAPPGGLVACRPA